MIYRSREEQRRPGAVNAAALSGGRKLSPGMVGLSDSWMVGRRVAAPSTLRTFVQVFPWGHARQLDRVSGTRNKVRSCSVGAAGGI